MAGTIIVGVILALMFLVAFSEWFFHLTSSVNQLIPSGFGFYSRLIKWSLGGLFFMAMVFWVLSMAYECPKGDRREGAFTVMDCTVYWEVRGLIAGSSAAAIKEQVIDGSDQFDY